MFFRFTCKQCGYAYYPRMGPATACPNCLAEPDGGHVQVVAWYILTASILITVAYLAVERRKIVDVGRDHLSRFLVSETAPR